MDSISQLALGAALGELTLGRHLGRRALILGAVLGTLPDLDVLVRYGDAVEGFTRHRSWSHSLPILALASLPIALLAQRFFQSGKAGTVSHSPSLARWYVAVAVILTTHPLLDAFTTYGTQLFWPLPLPPVAIGSVFIIDPLYTAPLLIGIVWAWRRRTALARRACQVGLCLSTAYLGLTLLSQAHARQIGESLLIEQGLPTDALLVAPFPFSVLWRFVTVDDQRYYEGWYSLLDSNEVPAPFSVHERNLSLLQPIEDHEPIERLAWFTDGHYAASRQDAELILTDLRIGAESGYIFTFAVAIEEEQDWRPIVSRALPPQVDADGLKQLLNRYLDASLQAPVPTR